MQTEPISRVTNEQNRLYASNSLTNFEYEPHAIPETLLCEFVETCMGKLVKSHLVNPFLAGFRYVKPLCATTQC